MLGTSLFIPFLVRRTFRNRAIHGNGAICWYHMLKRSVTITTPKWLLLILQKSTILVVTAATDVSTSPCTPDTEKECFETSRCVFFEFSTSLSDVRLVKLGQGNFNGPATGLGILTREGSELTTILFFAKYRWVYIDTPSFFSINDSGHFVTYELDFSPPIPIPTNQSSLATTSEGDHNHHTTHLPTLPILDSLKSIMSRSTEHLPPNEAGNHAIGGEKSSKTILSEPHDVGVLLTDPILAGLSLRHRQDGTLCGLAWAHRELTVRFRPFLFISSVLICFSYSSMESSRWGFFSICPIPALDTLRGWVMIAMQYPLRYFNYTFVHSGLTEYWHQGRVEVYRIKHVNADNEDDPCDHKDIQWHPQYVQFPKVCNLLFTPYLSNRPELTCVLDVGQHHCITFSGHQELLITRLLEEGHQLQVVAFPITENIDSTEPIHDKSTSQVVWQTSNDDYEGSSKIVLTSALPLELDSIIQGYCGFSRIYEILKLIYRCQRTVVFVNFRWLKLQESLTVQPFWHHPH